MDGYLGTRMSDPKKMMTKNQKEKDCMSNVHFMKLILGVNLGRVFLEFVSFFFQQILSFAGLLRIFCPGKAPKNLKEKARDDEETAMVHHRRLVLERDHTKSEI